MLKLCFLMAWHSYNKTVFKSHCLLFVFYQGAKRKEPMTVLDDILLDASSEMLSSVATPPVMVMIDQDDINEMMSSGARFITLSGTVLTRDSTT